MSLFPDKPLLRTRVMRATLPKVVADHIKSGDYTAAADALCQSGISFNEAVRLICNSPRTLAAYLYNQSNNVNASPAAQQIICHLYLQTALFSLSALPRAEKDQEMARIRKFFEDNRASLSKKLVMKYIRDSGETSLTYDALLAFNDYEGVVDYLMSIGDYVNLPKFLLLVPVEQQRWVFMRFARKETMKLTEFLDSKNKPSMDAIFDTFVTLSLTAPKIGDVLQSNTLENFEEFERTGKLVEPAHYHLLFIFWSLLGYNDKIEKFYQTPAFKIMDKDFIVTYLVTRGMYSMAADIYARVDDRHILAISYALKDSMKKTLFLLQKMLAKAHDARACWIHALKMCSNPDTKPADCDWAELICAADKSKMVTLDDIFPLVPPDMAMDSLHMVIANAVQLSSNDMKKSEETRRRIEERADVQRSIVNNQKTKPLEIDPIDAMCFICGQPACDSAFAAFPCGHICHTACYLTSGGSCEVRSLATLGESCPACGTASLVILDTPFVDQKAELAEIRRWEIPE